MSYAAKRLLALQAKLAGERPSDFSQQELLEMEFENAAIIIAGTYPDTWL